MNSVLYMNGKMQESGLIKIIPLICTLTTQGLYPAFLHPESPQGSQLGVTTVADGLIAAKSFVYLYVRGHPQPLQHL